MGMLPRYTVRLVPDRRPGVTDAAGLPKAALPKLPMPLTGDCGAPIYCWLAMPSDGSIPVYRPGLGAPCVGLPIWLGGFGGCAAEAFGWEKPPKLANCGEVNADGVPGWKGLPSSSWEGRRGVKFISNVVPGVAISEGLAATG